SQYATRFDIGLVFEADFADQAETNGPREQTGTSTRQWRAGAGGGGELEFHYHAARNYEHQGEKGHAEIHRGLIVRVNRSDSPARARVSQLIFDVALGPRGTWRACLSCIPTIDGEPIGLTPVCESGIHAADDAYGLRQDVFLT